MEEKDKIPNQLGSRHHTAKGNNPRIILGKKSECREKGQARLDPASQPWKTLPIHGTSTSSARSLHLVHGSKLDDQRSRIQPARTNPLVRRLVEASPESPRVLKRHTNKTPHAPHDGRGGDTSPPYCHFQRHECRLSKRAILSTVRSSLKPG